jgi:hypothetical protein
MHAYTFAALNDLPVVITGYHAIRLGPYLRGEKSKRQYSGYFRFQKNLLLEQLDKWKYHNKGKTKVAEPALEIISEKQSSADIQYLFSEMPHWSDAFAKLKPHRGLVIKLFRSVLSPGILKQVEERPSPFIGVHIRMGDFRKLSAGEDFSKVGSVRTPESYFVDTIKRIREVHRSDLPVTVFTDGHKHEFQEIDKMRNISFSEGNRDIVDLLLLSKSRIIVTSAGSTFSFWAGFLSDAPLILHPDHIHESIRPAELSSSHYEGEFTADSTLLTDQIRSIHYHNLNNSLETPGSIRSGSAG